MSIDEARTAAIDALVKVAKAADVKEWDLQAYLMREVENARKAGRKVGRPKYVKHPNEYNPNEKKPRRRMR